MFALLVLEKKATALSSRVAAPVPPPPQVYLGEKFVNNETLADIRFVIEGIRFYAHRIALLASSDAFRAMFDGGYKEKEATYIEIPNISWRVFELMIRFLYTDRVEVTLEIAQDLLRASDQYLLEGLKRLCEECIAKDLTVENVAGVFDLAEAHHAIFIEADLYFIYFRIVLHFEKDSLSWMAFLIFVCRSGLELSSLEVLQLCQL